MSGYPQYPSEQKFACISASLVIDAVLLAICAGLKLLPVLCPQVMLWDTRLRSSQPRAALTSPTPTGAIKCLQADPEGNAIIAGTKSGEVRVPSPYSDACHDVCRFPSTDYLTGVTGLRTPWVTCF